MLKNKNWWRAAAIRALKTVAQSDEDALEGVEAA